MLTPKSAGGRNWKASMAQDVAKGRPTEIDYMNGFVVEKGREKGVPTPVSAAVVETVGEIDRGQRKQAAENIGLTLKRAGV
jgi:2-dehydropantoate 2-reductase